MQPLTREARFRAIYDAHYEAVLRFARRRSTPDVADDVVSETFMVAWRRLDALPEADGEQLPWLYAVARNCLLTAHRHHARQAGIAVRLGSQPSGLPAQDTNTLGAVETRLDLTSAWASLSDADQEVLALGIFEDLTSSEAAAVLGISAATYRVRLFRARSHLKSHLHPAATATSPADLNLQETP